MSRPASSWDLVKLGDVLSAPLADAEPPAVPFIAKYRVIREVDRWTLKSILRAAEISVEEFIQSL